MDHYDGRCVRCGWLHLTPDCPRIIARPTEPVNEGPCADLSDDDVRTMMREDEERRNRKYDARLAR